MLHIIFFHSKHVILNLKNIYQIYDNLSIFTRVGQRKDIQTPGSQRVKQPGSQRDKQIGSDTPDKMKQFSIMLKGVNKKMACDMCVK